MMKFARKFSANRSGATAIEYGLIAAGIALAIAAAVALIGPNLTGIFNNIQTKTAAANTAAP